MSHHLPHARLTAPERLRAVERSGLGTEGRDLPLNRLARLAARLVGTQAAMTSVVLPDGQLIKGLYGLDLPADLRLRTPLDHSLCRFVVEEDAPLAVEDVQRDPRGEALPDAVRSIIGAYLGVPMCGADGEILGAVCAISPEARTWSKRDVGMLKDLAAAASAELQVRRERARREALRSVDGTAFTADPEGHIVWMGAAWEALTGQPVAEARGRGWARVVHPEDRGAFVEAWARALAERRPFAREVRVVPPGGTPRRIRMRAEPSVESGLLVEYAGAWADVEPERRAEEAAARAEALVESVYAAAPLAMGVIEVLPNALVDVRHNPAAESLSGIPRTPIWEAGTTGPSPASQGVMPWLEACHRVTQQKRPMTFEYELRRPGRTLHLSVKLTPAGTSENGRPLCAYFAEDITYEHQQQRRLDQSEERLRLALHSAEMGTWGWDLRAGALDWSPQMLTLCGLTTFDGTVGSALTAIYQPDRGRYLRMASAAVERARREAANADLRVEFRIPIGSALRWVRISGRVYVDAAGVPERMAGVAVDVTEEVVTAEALLQASETARRAAEAARKAQARAEEAARLKESILNNMSHEIRTPLTTVIGYADLLAEESETADAEIVAAIDRGAKRLLSTLNSVLDLARLESGISIQRERIDVCEEAREAVQLFEARARQKGLLLVLDAPPVPVHAVADQGGVQRTLSNLISNAIKFTTEGSVTVRVREHDGWVALEVSDTGAGMSSAFVHSAFEPFRQESEGVGRIHEGTGIGLSIVKQLVHLMGGTIEVTSVQGAGTTFLCLLPIASIPEPPAERAMPHQA